MEAVQYLFLFELLGMVDLSAIKNSFIGNTLPTNPLRLPSPASLYTMLNGIFVSLCHFTSFYWHGVSPSLSLFVHFASPFASCLHPSLAFFSKNLACM